MPDWLLSDAAYPGPLSLKDLALRLLIAAAYGICVAGIYRLSHGRAKAEAQVLVATLVLLSILIAMVTMVIGDSVARAFSLVGALSIVRFRTVVEDTRDTAFVIFAVIVGMAAGSGLLLVPLLGIPLIAVISVALSLRSSVRSEVAAAEHALSVRIGLGRDADGMLRKHFDQHLHSWRLVKLGTARQGAAIDLEYRIRLRDLEQAANLVSALNQVEGVQSVDLRLE